LRCDWRSVRLRFSNACFDHISRSACIERFNDALFVNAGSMTKLYNEPRFFHHAGKHLFFGASISWRFLKNGSTKTKQPNGSGQLREAPRDHCG
jgi:hypothetical protein